MDREVDVQLFITCRLCLEEPGSYQIVPSIKDQMIFCFGVHVDPFDGLPQLICKKCKNCLCEYYAVKSKFVNKQLELLNNYSNQTKESPEQSPAAANISSRGQSAASHDAAMVAAPEVAVPRVAAPEVAVPEVAAPPVAVPEVAAPAHSSAAAIAPCSNPDTLPAAADPTPQHNTRKRTASWKKDFIRYFVCTICNKEYLARQSIKKHINTHKTVTSKHDKILRNYVTVSLNKIDKKRNNTGSLKNVVYSNDKVISDEVNCNYTSYYLRKSKETCGIETKKNENVAGKKPRILSDSSDEEMIKGKKRKTGRLLSTSSTQTVILEESKDKCNATVQADDQNQTIDKKMVNAECINLDTSSECPRNSSEPVKTRTLPQRQQPKPKVADYKAIQTIVTMCHKNYIKKAHSDDASTKTTFSESSLKHKVLSLGRKVINKQGFPCTGLLRYMEHKDLEITWTPPSVAMSGKGYNFVRIMTKLKSREDSENEDAGWKNMHETSFCRDNAAEVNTCGSLTTETENEVVASAARASPPPQILETLLTAQDDDFKYTNKLLNKTPAVNSKQLPKKNNISEVQPETKTVIVRTNDTALLTPAPVGDEVAQGQVDDSNMCLPIITSTTSLSCPNETQKPEIPVVEKPPPRIKVKPASELMSERALSNREIVNDPWAFNMGQSALPRRLTNVNVYSAPPSVPDSHTYISMPTSENLPPVICQNDTQPDGTNLDRAKTRNHEYVTLHCPDLPNTRTKSPFHYFKTVLLVHGIKLLDLNDDLPLHFQCLIKFQLLLEQNSKKPIKVLFSLYCSWSTFCFTFKDAHLKTFDPNQLPAFWQWELLKVYRGDVVDRILQNALKIGKEVHEFTKHFLCLLKSIDLIKES